MSTTRRMRRPQSRQNSSWNQFWPPAKLFLTHYDPDCSKKSRKVNVWRRRWRTWSWNISRKRNIGRGNNESWTPSINRQSLRWKRRFPCSRSKTWSWLLSIYWKSKIISKHSSFSRRLLRTSSFENMDWIQSYLVWIFVFWSPVWNT